MIIRGAIVVVYPAVAQLVTHERVCKHRVVVQTIPVLTQAEKLTWSVLALTDAIVRRLGAERGSRLLLCFGTLIVTERAHLILS